MPVYVYETMDDDGNGTGELFEHYQSMSEDALEFAPDTDIPVRRVPQAPMLIDMGEPRTLGSLAEKNTEKMIKNNDPRIKKSAQKERPFWRPDKDKPIDINGKSKKDIEKYIYEGKK